MMLGLEGNLSSILFSLLNPDGHGVFGEHKSVTINFSFISPICGNENENEREPKENRK